MKTRIQQIEEVINQIVSEKDLAEIENLMRGAERKGIGYGGKVFSEIKKVIADTGGKPGALIRVLQQAQGVIGYLPNPVIATISRDLKIPLSEVYGVISFYHFFSMKPKGRYVVQVCMGTSCYVKGGGTILENLKRDWALEPGGITSDGRFSLEIVRCLGACGLSPVIAVGTDIHGRVKANKVGDILDAYD